MDAIPATLLLLALHSPPPPKAVPPENWRAPPLDSLKTLSKESTETVLFTSVELKPLRKLSSAEMTFEPGIHIAIVDDRGLPRYCADALARAQWSQDVFHAFYAPAHFDNCRVRDSVEYLQRLLRDADKAVQADDPDGMLEALGRGLHLVHDFYAHTNYVDLMAAEHATLDEVSPVDLWSKGAEKRLERLIKAGLVSGKVWWERGDECPDGVPSHELMNLDSPQSLKGRTKVARWGVSYHVAARSLASKATGLYLAEFLRRKPWAALAPDCATRVAYPLVFDARREH